MSRIAPLVRGTDIGKSNSVNSSGVDKQAPFLASATSSRRLDIQGLRAIAVLMVVAFHAGLPLPGGFVGVDVFFVLSGFVITAMLQREWTRTGKIRFGTFYLKRFKRLTPALAVMVAVTMLVSAVVLSALGPQQSAAKTGIGAMLLAANLVIARTSGGYFDLAAEANPLLNTWSLSVEEQFYLIFPALIALGWVLARRQGILKSSPIFIVSSIAIVSFALTIASSNGVTFRGSGTILGFYSPFTRAWEFAVGALLALILTTINRRFSPGIMTTLGLVGVALLGASLWLITGSTIFPGPWTLLPVAGTLLLLIAGTQKNKVSDTLGARPMVKIGNVSYSIYLWHWPFIAFSTYLWPFEAYIAVIAALVSLAPALASYKWIEQPLRTLSTPSRAKVTKLIAITMLPPILLSGLLGLTARFYWTPQYESGERTAFFTGDINVKGDFWRYSRGNYFSCEDDAASSIYLTSFDTNNIKDFPCGQSKKSVPVEVAIIGDSHASHLFVGLAEKLPTKNVAFFDYRGASAAEDNGYLSRVISYLENNPSIQTVIINAFWQPGISEKKLAQVLRSITSTDKQVFLADDNPHYPFAPERCKYGLSPFLPFNKCTQGIEYFSSSYANYYPQLESAAKQVAGLQILNTAKYFCDLEECSMTNNGEVLYQDSHHLNHQGSVFIAERLLAENQDFKNAVSAR